MINKIFTLISVAALTYLSAGAIEIGGISYKISENGDNTCRVISSEGSAYTGQLTIPASIVYSGTTYEVKGIEEYAFAGCEGLESLTLPAGISSVGRNAFQGCSRLETMEFPSGVKEIRDQTFYGCSGLAVFKGPGVSSIGNGSFSNCTSLQEITTGKLSHIGDSGFRNCTLLTSFEFPSGIEIGTGIFSGCSSLSEVVWSATLNEVPPFTFSECSALDLVKNIDRAEIIGDYAFSSCSDLRNLSLSKNLLRIGKGAFSMCTSLQISSLAGNEAVIEDYAFMGCSALQSIKFTGVKEVGLEAFSNAKELIAVRFDDTIRKIGERCFYSCDKIGVVGCNAILPPDIATHSFNDITYRNATLVVPQDLILLYRQTPPWTNFVNVSSQDPMAGADSIHAEEASVTVRGETVVVKGFSGEIEVYSLSGEKIMSRTAEAALELSFRLGSQGIYLVRMGEETKKIIIR